MNFDGRRLMSFWEQESARRPLMVFGRFMPRAKMRFENSGQGVWSRHEQTLTQAFKLTRFESAVARECVKGLSNREIGEVLGIGEETVNVYLDRVFRKAKIKRRGHLAAILLLQSDRAL
jgi:DNA-binding CsgD family transcriptional regulator